MIDRLKELIGKKIFLETNSGRIYNGTINDVNDTLISLTDKYDEPVFISISDIKTMQVKR